MYDQGYQGPLVPPQVIEQALQLGAKPQSDFLAVYMQSQCWIPLRTFSLLLQRGADPNCGAEQTIMEMLASMKQPYRSDSVYEHMLALLDAGFNRHVVADAHEDQLPPAQISSLVDLACIA